MAKNIWAYDERQQYYLASLLETNVFEIHVFFITSWRKNNKLIIYSPRKIEKIAKRYDSTQDRTGDVLRVKQMPWPTRPSNHFYIKIFWISIMNYLKIITLQ